MRSSIRHIPAAFDPAKACDSRGSCGTLQRSGETGGRQEDCITLPGGDNNVDNSIPLNHVTAATASDPIHPGMRAGYAAVCCLPAQLPET